MMICTRLGTAEAGDLRYLYVHNWITPNSGWTYIIEIGLNTRVRITFVRLFVNLLCIWYNVYILKIFSCKMYRILKIFSYKMYWILKIFSCKMYRILKIFSCKMYRILKIFSCKMYQILKIFSCKIPKILKIFWLFTRSGSIVWYANLIKNMVTINKRFWEEHNYD